MLLYCIFSFCFGVARGLSPRPEELAQTCYKLLLREEGHNQEEDARDSANSNVKQLLLQPVVAEDLGRVVRHRKTQPEPEKRERAREELNQPKSFPKMMGVLAEETKRQCQGDRRKRKKQQQRTVEINQEE